MPKFKRGFNNWDKLKLLFFKSNHTHATLFLADYFEEPDKKPVRRCFTVMAAGWAKEKKEWLAKKAEAEKAAIEQAELDLAKKIRSNLSKLHETLADQIGDDHISKKMTAQEVATFWKILRTVIGEPTVVTKNTNINIETTLKKAKLTEDESLRKLKEEGLI